MSQEPGTDAEIKAFAQGKYNAKFPMFSKIEVNGENTHPIYKWLRLNSSLANKGRTSAGNIPWNFAKFVVDEHGLVVSFHEPRTNPLKLEKEITEMLK